MGNEKQTERADGVRINFAQPPVKMAAGFCKADGVLSKLIQRITGSPYSHAFIVFEWVDGTRYYYEAMAGKGCRGPLPMTKVLARQAESPTTRTVVTVEIPMQPACVAAKHAVARSYVGRVGYREIQLLGMWAVERLGVRLPSTPNGVVCSEYLARVLEPEFDLRDEDHPTFDMVTPGSAARALTRAIGEMRRRLDHE